MKNTIKMCAVGMLLCCVATGCGPSNPLIGSWTRVGNNDGCSRALKFTSSTMTNNLSGEETTTDVTYNMGTNKVTVTGNVWNPVTYDINSSNQITLRTAYGDCVFTRN